LLINLLFFFIVTPAEAHFPAKDGDMTVTLHVDPNDDPIPGKQAHLYFLFTDASNKFKLANCTCTVSVAEEGTSTHMQQQLNAYQSNKPSIWGASMPYTFPERNVYHIVLSGKPKKESEFEPFTVSWYFRVDTINPGLTQRRLGPSDIEVLLGAFGIGIIILVFIGLFIKKELSHEFQT